MNSENSQSNPTQGPLPPQYPPNQYPGNQYPGWSPPPPPPPYQQGPYGNPYYAYGPPAGYHAPIDPNTIRHHAKQLKDASVAQIVLFFLWIVLMFLIVIFVILATFATLSLASPYAGSYDYSESGYVQIFYIITIFFVVIFSLIWGIGILVSSICGAVAASRLTNIPNANTIMILYIVGIFFPILSVVAAFMSLSQLKKLNLR